MHPINIFSNIILPCKVQIQKGVFSAMGYALSWSSPFSFSFTALCPLLDGLSFERQLPSEVSHLAITSSILYVGLSCEIKRFCLSGVELPSIRIPYEVVSMASYEDTLAVAVNQGVGYLGYRQMHVQFFGEQTKEIPCALDQYRQLKWMGFSEEGMLII